MNYFIIGTDTHVGKTLISCALLYAFAAQGLRVVGMKPIAAGIDADGQHEDVKKLRAASNVLASLGQVNPYLFMLPIAPHIAARNSGVRIEIARILQSYHELAAQADVVVVEGAGGFCVPINERETSADLAQQLALPIILVVGMRLGCLNHALLTLSATEAQGLKCAGWIANVLNENMQALEENIEALQQRIDAPLLGVVPWNASGNPDARWVAGKLNVALLG